MPEQRADSATEKKSSVGLIVLLVITLLLSAGAGFYALRPSSAPGVSPTASLAACSGSGLASCVANSAVQIAEADGVAKALDAVRMAIESRRDLREGCHTLTHTLGNRLFERFGDEAAVPGNNWCSWGYYHGLMQAYGKTDIDNLVPFATTLCTKVDGGTPTLDCMHGIGHAAYANLRDIGKSLPVCGAVSNEELARSCADGVIMEETLLSPNGRLTSAFTVKDCLSYTNPAVVAGCARGMASELVALGLLLDESCSLFTGYAYRECANGYGSRLSGNKVSGSTIELSEDQFASCATSDLCTSGYGWIGYMYLLDVVRAEAGCKEVYSGSALASCVAGVQQASKRETLQART